MLPDHAKLTDIVISHENVKAALDKINTFKSAGPDDIHPKLLKSLAGDSQFVNAIYELFRDCIDK